MKFSSESRGVIRLPFAKYGCSVLGAPLRYIPCTGPCRMLVIAGIHGEEPETTFLLSRALRAFETPFESVAFVLCANPDGMMLGTRGNANGVDSVEAIKKFTSSILRKSNQISVNPVEYLNKTVVAYKNPGKNFTNPYTASAYSGYMFNSYC